MTIDKEEYIEWKKKNVNAYIFKHMMVNWWHTGRF